MVASLKTVAAHAGVSLRTAAYILNSDESHRFRPETRAKVLRSAKELGYRANAAARTMRTGRFNAVALLSASGSVPSAGILWTGLSDGLAARDYHLTISRLEPAVLAGEAPPPKVLRQLVADALVIGHEEGGIPPQVLDIIEAQQLPVLWNNRLRPTNGLLPDDIAGGRNATRRLIEAGHRAIAYIGHGEAGHISRLHRLQGYREAMQAAGLTPVLLAHVPPEGHSHWGRRQVARLEEVLRTHDRPTAVVGYSTTEASLALAAARRCGLSMPTDLALCCIGHQMNDHQGLDFSAEVFPHYDLGQAMATLVLDVLNAPDHHLPSRLLPPRCHPGETVIAPA
jgi:LacI family transcriptional regulator